MNSKEHYDGFANYETWVVSLWMSNDEQSYEHFRELARCICSSDEPTLKHLTRTEADIVTLAKALQDELEEYSPVRDHATVYADLMNAALSEVDWHELATELLSDIEEDS